MFTISHVGLLIEAEVEMRNRPLLIHERCIALHFSGSNDSDIQDAGRGSKDDFDFRFDVHITVSLTEAFAGGLVEFEFDAPDQFRGYWQSVMLNVGGGGRTYYRQDNPAVHPACSCRERYCGDRYYLPFVLN